MEGESLWFIKLSCQELFSVEEIPNTKEFSQTLRTGQQQRQHRRPKGGISPWKSHRAQSDTCIQRSSFLLLGPSWSSFFIPLSPCLEHPMASFAQSHEPPQISHIIYVNLISPFVSVTKLRLILESAGFLQLHSTYGETELCDFWPVWSINTASHADTHRVCSFGQPHCRFKKLILIH